MGRKYTGQILDTDGVNLPEFLSRPDRTILQFEDNRHTAAARSERNHAEWT